MTNITNPTINKSTVFLKDYLYLSKHKYQIIYTALSFKSISNLQEIYMNYPNQYTVNIVKTALKDKSDFQYLTGEDIDILSRNIIENSTLTNSDMEVIELGLDVVFADAFADESFSDCSICQERGLDKQRNCPLLSKDTHDKGVFYIVGKKRIVECPMDKANSTLVRDALKTYNMLDAGVLPEQGGVADQTMFFYQVAQMVKNYITKEQNKRTEEASRR